MLRRLRTSNTLVGIFLLMILAFLSGPDRLPRLISTLIPFIDEGVPCSNLRVTSDRDRHQSIIGRIASSRTAPITLWVDPDDIPNDPSATMVIRVIVTNESIGTIPIVFPGDVLINNTSVSGLGIVFNNQPIQPVAPQAGLVPDSNIRLLLPRQRCVERINIPVAALAQLGVTEGSRVTAFYRNTTSGTLAGQPGAIFPDQGLWIGLQTSPTVTLRRAPVETQ